MNITDKNGKHAMKMVVDEYLNNKCRILRTSFAPQNTGAKKVYESLGFQSTGEICDGEEVMFIEKWKK
ncbi:MAG: hypothetical protein U9N62_12905 [Thermotogota bacterium]|nr:hypothetical protein [Thermotogota bacterium]